MTKQKVEYECIRCGYTTSKKTHIRRHLYDLKKPCHGSQHDIELTDAVRESILANKIYHLPTPQPAITQQIINNINSINQINNFVTQMNPTEKLNTYMEYNNMETTNFEDMIETKYKKDIRRLESDSYRYPRQLKKADFYDIVDDLTLLSTATMDNLNTYYDEKSNRLNIYTDGEWQSFWFDKGMNEVIEKIKVYYLDTYELYLIRKIEDSHGELPFHTKTQLRERLEDYYLFIQCFDLQPYIYGRDDNSIMNNNKQNQSNNYIDDYIIADKYNTLFNQIKENLKVVEMNKMRKNVKEIIKSNTKSNIVELNKKVIDLLKIDEEFKNNFVENMNNT